MINHFFALLLGLIEGFTEFLPISSTAHLILASDALRIPQSPFTKTFEIVTQSGAILAVVVLYIRKFFEWEVLKRLAIAFLPTGVLGLIFYRVVKTYLIGNTAIALYSLAVGGALLILFEYLTAEPADSGDVKSIGYGQAFVIGLCQSVAMIPGVSRSAATIVSGMLLGIGRRTIVEFSFLLAVPTLAAATGLDLIKNYRAFSSAQFTTLGIGFFVSFVMALLGIRFLLGYVRGHTFTVFGIYRIALVAVAVLVMLVI